MAYLIVGIVLAKVLQFWGKIGGFVSFAVTILICLAISTICVACNFKQRHVEETMEERKLGMAATRFFHQ